MANKSYERFTHVGSPHGNYSLSISHANYRVPLVEPHVADVLKPPAMFDNLFSGGYVEVLKESKVIRGA